MKQMIYSVPFVLMVKTAMYSYFTLFLLHLFDLEYDS